MAGALEGVFDRVSADTKYRMDDAAARSRRPLDTPKIPMSDDEWARYQSMGGTPRSALDMPSDLTSSVDSSGRAADYRAGVAAGTSQRFPPAGSPTPEEAAAAEKPYIGYKTGGAKASAAPVAAEARRPENGPGRVAPGSGPPLPKAGAPALPNPEPASKPDLKPVENPTGGFTPIKSTNPETPYDADIRFAHDVARMLAMGGDAEGHQQYLQQWDQLSAKRVQHIADDAIRALATGNVDKAIAIHNHVVPNGRQIVGYKPVEGGFEFQYDDGKTEKGSNAQIANMLTQYKDPSYLIQVGLKTAIARNDMAKETHKQGLIGQRELTVQQFKDQNAVAMKQLEKQLDMNTVAGISRGTAPGDTAVYVRMKAGPIYKMTEEPGIPVNGKPGPPQMKLTPVNAPQAPQGAAPSGIAGAGGVGNIRWGVNEFLGQ